MGAGGLLSVEGGKEFVILDQRRRMYAGMYA